MRAVECFDAEKLKTLQGIFSEICRNLDLSEARGGRDEIYRDRLAQLIFRIAESGESDAGRIREQVTRLLLRDA